MPTETVHSALRDSLVLASLQLLGAAAVTVPAVLVVGACAAWVPVLGTLGAAFVWLRLRGVGTPGWLTRDRIRRLAVHSGLVHGALAAIGYFGVYSAFPATFDLPTLAALGVSPLLGAGVGITALALTLCGGDAAAATLGERLPASPR